MPDPLSPAREPATGAPQPRTPITPSDVSVIVPVGGTAPWWDVCARSLTELDPQPMEIVVVADGPDLVSKCSGSIPGATVVTLDPQAGPAAARNLGARHAAGSVLFFVDSDVSVPADIVARVVGHFESRRDLAAIIGSYDAEPAARGFLSQYRNLLHHYVHQRGNPEASTFWGACGAVTRDAFEQVGGFDQRFRAPSIEDIELGHRLRRAGYTIGLIGDLQIKHLKVWRPADLLVTDLFRRAVPWTELMLRSGRLLDDLNVAVESRLSAILAWLGLGGLLLAFWQPVLLALTLAATIGLLVLNRGLAAFFIRRRGIAFALKAVFWYWLYLLICGLGFTIGLARVTVSGGRSSPER